MLYIIILVLLALTLLAVLVILQPLIHILPLKLKYGSRALLRYFPIIGLERETGLAEKKGDYYGFTKYIVRSQPNIKFIFTNFLNKPVVVFLDHTYGKQVFQEHQNYEKLKIILDDRLFNKGLFYTFGQKWKHQRSMLTKSFSFDKLKQRVPLFNDIVKEYLQKIDFNAFQPLNHLSMITGEVIIKSFFSSDMINAKLNNKLIQVELSDIVSELSYIVRKFPLFLASVSILGQVAWRVYPNQYIKQVKKRIDDLLQLCKNIINGRLEAKKDHYLKNLPEEQEEDQDFLDVFLKEYVNQKDKENGITIDEVVQQFITFFFAGTDTTAHTVATVLYYLAMDQDAQNELRTETTALFDDEGNIPHGVLNKFEKTTAFIKECLRMRNPASIIIPRLVMKDHFIKDIYVKKGWFISVPSMAMNYSDTQFENADQFIWRRWLNSDPIKPQQDLQYVYIPFSAGGRNCIGQHMAQMESKIILAHLLKNNRFEIDQSQKITWKLTLMYSFDPQDIIKVIKI